MSKTTIILICSIAFVVLVGFIVIVRIINRKRFKKLQENLKKIKLEKEDLERDKRISLPSQPSEPAIQEPAISQTVESLDDVKSTNGKQPIVEEYVPYNEQTQTNPFSKMDTFDENQFKKDLKDDFFQELSRQQKRDFAPQKEDDFEKFMNDYSYSRNVVNESLLDKIKKMPPEIRMLLLSNIFDRYDDDKK